MNESRGADSLPSAQSSRTNLRFTQYVPESKTPKPHAPYRENTTVLRNVFVPSPSSTTTKFPSSFSLQMNPTVAHHTHYPPISPQNTQHSSPFTNQNYFQHYDQRTTLAIPPPSISLHPSHSSNQHKYQLSHILLKNNVENTAATALHDFSRAIAIHEGIHS